MQVKMQWTDALPIGESLTILKRLALRHANIASNSSCPEVKQHGEQLQLLLRSDDFGGVIGYVSSINLNSVLFADDPQGLYHLRQVGGFFSKLEDLELGICKEAVTLSKWKQAEDQCESSNALFCAIYQARELNLVNPAVLPAIKQARKLISRVLGRVPDPSELDFRFSTGATVGTKRDVACPMTKMAATPTCSETLAFSSLLPSLIRELPMWFDQHATSWWIKPRHVRHGVEGPCVPSPFNTEEIEDLGCDVEFRVVPAKLGFVPKTASVLRVTETQSTANMVFQLAYGDWITARLRRAGIDISDQVPNQELALLGSLTDDLATVDLSSASDTIAYWLVKVLLPEQWFEVLSTLRHPTIKLPDGTVLRLQKFSGMGNGFTFPLETLIFWALTMAASSNTQFVRAYGDDIVCQSADYLAVKAVLEFCGFSVNTAKTFSQGPFRESCGKDYFRGIEIRPFYQKHLVSGETLFSLHNYYYRKCDSAGATMVRALIPANIRLYGPDGYGDGHLLASEWPSALGNTLRVRETHRDSKGAVLGVRYAKAAGWCGSYFKSYKRTGRKILSPYPCDDITPMYHAYSARGARIFSMDALEAWHRSDVMLFAGLSEAPMVKFDSSGRPYWPVPDSEGYEVISIYTFITP